MPKTAAQIDAEIAEVLTKSGRRGSRDARFENVRRGGREE